MNRKISVVIPAYNEEKRIGSTLSSYLRNFNDTEFIVVMDGCKDKTLDIVKTFSENKINGNIVRYLHFDKRLGKGGGIVQGFKCTEGDIIAITDADGSINPSEILKLINNLDGFEGVLGSRWLSDSKILIKQPLKRRIASRCFNFIVRNLFDIPFRDTQCGAKVFRKNAVKSVVDKISTYNFAFDIDLLYQLHKNGFKIKEIPITWNDEGGSSIKLFRTSITMFLSVIRLKMVNSRFRLLIENSFVEFLYNKKEGEKE